MVDILQSERGKEMDKVRQTLAEAARQRQRGTTTGIGVGVRAW
jgi:hypothetical protein